MTSHRLNEREMRLTPRTHNVNIKTHDTGKGREGVGHPHVYPSSASLPRQCVRVVCGEQTKQLPVFQPQCTAAAAAAAAIALQ